MSTLREALWGVLGGVLGIALFVALSAQTIITGRIPVPVSVANGGTGASFSSTAQGNLWYFSGTGTIAALAPGTSGQFLQTQGAGANPTWAAGGISVLDRVSADTAFSNSAAENTLYTRAIAGGTLSTNVRLRLVIYGTVTAGNTGVASTLTIRLKYGATTLATHSFTQDDGTAAPNAARAMRIVFMLSGDNATNAQLSNSEVWAFAVSAGAFAAFEDPNTRGTATIDSTASQNMVVTAQMSGINANLGIRLEHAVLEQL